MVLYIDINEQYLVRPLAHRQTIGYYHLISQTVDTKKYPKLTPPGNGTFVAGGGSDEEKMEENQKKIKDVLTQ